MSGENDSNMQKIDAALGQKADSSVSASKVLSASGWLGAASPFTQNISIDGVTEQKNGTIQVSHEATLEQREIARCAMLSVVGQGDGFITIAADGDLPEKDIPVTIILFG